MALTPSFSTGGMLRPHAGNVGTGISSLLKFKMPALKSGSMGKGVSLKGVTIPKGSTAKMGKMPKMPAFKAPKSTMPKAASLSSALKSIVSGAGKVRGMAGPGMAMPSAIGAPASAPAPAFFGSAQPGPGQPGLGM